MSDSFKSLLNWQTDDYIAGHVLRAARRSGGTTLRIDLLTGEAHPEALAPEPVTRSVMRFHSDFPRLLTASGADPSLIVSAYLTLHFDNRDRAAGDQLSDALRIAVCMHNDDPG